MCLYRSAFSWGKQSVSTMPLSRPCWQPLRIRKVFLLMTHNQAHASLVIKTYCAYSAAEVATAKKTMKLISNSNDCDLSPKTQEKKPPKNQPVPVKKEIRYAKNTLFPFGLQMFKIEFLIPDTRDDNWFVFLREVSVLTSLAVWQDHLHRHRFPEQ